MEGRGGGEAQGFADPPSPPQKKMFLRTGRSSDQSILQNFISYENFSD
jgi:hypothetical protein